MNIRNAWKNGWMKWHGPSGGGDAEDETAGPEPVKMGRDDTMTNGGGVIALGGPIVDAAPR